MRKLRLICVLVGFAGLALAIVSVLTTWQIESPLSMIGIGLIILSAIGFWILKFVGAFVSAKEIIKTGIEITKKTSTVFVPQKEQEPQETKPVTKTCPYCETTYTGDTDCPNCGSSTVEM
ncbi:MAG: hypothetical protein J6Q51_02015 [Clostridia bacterium]|nr:hypothetical protein [Clostridia bacterium]